MAAIDIEKAKQEAKKQDLEEDAPAKKAVTRRYNDDDDKSDSKSGVNFTPVFGAGDKDYLLGIGRISGYKDVGKDSELSAHADVMASKFKGSGAKVSPIGIGVNYRKSFKKGGKVKSASVRADGIAQRGKTRA